MTKTATNSSATAAAAVTAAVTEDDEPSQRGKRAPAHDQGRRAENAAYGELKDFLFGKLASMLARFIAAGAQNTSKEMATDIGDDGDGMATAATTAAATPPATTAPATTPPVTTTTVPTASAVDEADDDDEAPTPREKQAHGHDHEQQDDNDAFRELKNFLFGKLLTMLARFIVSSGLFDLKKVTQGETGEGPERTEAAGTAAKTAEATETAKERPQAAPVAPAATANEDNGTGLGTSSKGETPLDIVA